MGLLIYFQVSIYFALKARKNMIKPCKKIKLAAKIPLKIIEESHKISSLNSPIDSSNFKPVLFDLVTSLKLNEDDPTTSPNSITENETDLKTKEPSVGTSIGTVPLAQFYESKSNEDFQKSSSQCLTSKNLSKNSLQTRNNISNNNNNKKINFNHQNFLKSFKQRVFKTQMNMLDQHHLAMTNNYAKNKKVFRTLLFVTMYLIIFWLPWIISWPIDAYCKCVPLNFYTLTYWMEYSNSLINSIILIISNQNFRKKLIDIFKKKKKTNGNKR
jgi:hypothetical protein